MLQQKTRLMVVMFQRNTTYLRVNLFKASSLVDRWKATWRSLHVVDGITLKVPFESQVNTSALNATQPSRELDSSSMASVTYKMDEWNE